MTNVLITGATGFVGRHLCHSLSAGPFNVRGTTRSSICRSGELNGCEFHVVPDIGKCTDWSSALENITHVVHLAGRAHILSDRSSDPLAEFRRINVAGTERLLDQCFRYGVERFIFLSSVKVHGESTSIVPFKASHDYQAADPYSRSKCEAEKLVEDAGRESRLETVIIRPPLVYGPGVGGNFLKLLRLIHKGYPLPFGRLQNRRSMVSVANLCDLIRNCLEKPEAVGRVFLASDDADISTASLVSLIAQAMGRPARLWPAPKRALTAVSQLLGRKREAMRLLESLQIDIEDTRRTLDWSPPESLEEGIRATVSWYLSTRIGVDA